MSPALLHPFSGALARSRAGDRLTASWHDTAYSFKWAHSFVSQGWRSQ